MPLPIDAADVRVATLPSLPSSLSILTMRKAVKTSSTAVPHLPIISYNDVAVSRGNDISHPDHPHREWTVVSGVVYDIGAFVRVHPGGGIIRLCVGRDATALIESYHGADAIHKVKRALTQQCRVVGRIEDEAAAERFAPENGFFTVVSRRVYAAVGANKHDFAMIAITEAVITVALYITAVIASSFYGSVLAAIAVGILTGRIGFLMHTANHCGAVRSPLLNAIFGCTMDLIGANSRVWQYEHQVAHHTEPNRFGRDNDCAIGNPILKMHPAIQHQWTQTYQHVLVPAAISIGFIKWFVSDFIHLYRGYVGNVTFPVDITDIAVLIVFKLSFIATRIVPPFLLFSPLHALLLVLLPLIIGAHYLENIFIVNHIQFGLVPADTDHWSVKQVRGTANWSSGSRWANLISGGLNHQIEHHLFPTLSIYLYPYISSIVQETCKDFALPYYNYPTFFSAYYHMLQYLAAMGKADFDPTKYTAPIARTHDSSDRL